jgi:hypothetical protein
LFVRGADCNEFIAIVGICLADFFVCADDVDGADVVVYCSWFDVWR